MVDRGERASDASLRINPEASPSPVYGAGLLIPLGRKPLARSNRAASALQVSALSSVD